VGIVGDVQQAVRQQVQRPQMYVPYAQLPLNQQGQGYRVVNLSFVPIPALQRSFPQCGLSLLKSIRALAMYDIRTVEDYASNQTLGDRIYLTLLGVFGGVAVLLAVVACTASWPIQLTSAPRNWRSRGIGRRILERSCPRTSPWADSRPNWSHPWHGGFVRVNSRHSTLSLAGDGN